LSADDKFYQKGLIITDNYSRKPVLDFESYSHSILNIIKNSYPHFTIGIFGEWGTGKTTLMRNIFNRLKEEHTSIVPVWFNAWRYERENQFALFPMLQTIANSIPEENNQKKKNVKKAISKLGRGFVKGLIKSVPEILSTVLPSVIGEPIKEIAENASSEINAEFMSRVDKISQLLINETLYSTEIETIEKAIEEVRDEEDYKIVVFIDDLDRCSPNTALEVLESIKVFLDIDGFIFVMGISHNKISQLITSYYKDRNKELEMEGEEYLKKMIQIPINLSVWNVDDIKDLIKDLLDKGIIHDNYKNIVRDNIPLISSIIENNPREIKRFLNNFIIAFEILLKLDKTNHQKSGDFEKTLLIMQAIQLKRNDFYNLLMIWDNKTRENIFKEIKELKDSKENIFEIPKSKKRVKNLDYMQIIKLSKDFKFDMKLWNLLTGNIDLLKNIQDWNIYRRATKVISESSSMKDYITIDSTPLLQSEGKVFTIPNSISEVVQLLSMIYWSFPRNRIEPFSYGKKWVLVDKLSGKVFYDIGSRSEYMRSKGIKLEKGPMALKKLEGLPTKKLIEVGITPGMELYVTAPESDISNKQELHKRH